MDAREELIRLWYDDPVLAHYTLFKHRHPQRSPDFHADMIRGWHGPSLRDLFLVFRGGAKSTIGEEALVIKTVMRDFHNLLIIGSTEARACERLHAVAHELSTNERLGAVFGDQRGRVWAENEIVTSTGLRLLAIGKGQALRGTKYETHRPDACLLDDVEEESDVKTAKARRDLKKWFMSEIVPALTPEAWIRCNATPLGVDSLAHDFETSGAWNVHKYPCKYLDDEGNWQSSWPARFALSHFDNVEKNMRRLGLASSFQAEYMVTAEHDEEKSFSHEMYVTEPRARTWEAVYGAFDPARTSKSSSAQTGHVAWSYQRDKLLIWEAWGKHLKPNEIVDAVFDFNDVYTPVAVGLEVDGVNDFLTQPIRIAMKDRGYVPVVELKAPVGKNDFIRSLQPWFHARDVIFTKDFPELREQLNSFPAGLVDIANALAYALKMRPGAPIYDGFGQRHVNEDLRRLRNEPAYLVVNATPGLVTGVLVQYARGGLSILVDFVREGEPSAVLLDIVNAANLTAGKRVEIVAPPIHWDRHLNVGLRQAAARVPIDMRQGLKSEMGRASFQQFLMATGRDEEPLLQISPEARWTLNGLSGGYARAVSKGGGLASYATEGPYRVLMEGLESFIALINVIGSPNEDSGDRNYSYTGGGRRYLSALDRR